MRSKAAVFSKVGHSEPTLREKIHDKLDGKPKDDRSRWVFDATCALVRRGVPDNIILSVLLDPDFKISAHVHDQKSGARKYAIRQIKRAKERVALSAAARSNCVASSPVIGVQQARCACNR